jgi:hypothetical protein
MLVINTRNDKLAAARSDFKSHGMLDGTCLSETLHMLSSNPDNTDNDIICNSDEDGLDLDADGNENDHSGNGPCGPIDGPPILGEVMLVLKKGVPCLHTF